MTSNGAYIYSLIQADVPLDWIAKDLTLSHVEVESIAAEYRAKLGDILAMRAAAWGPQDVYNETESLRDRWL